MGVIQGVRSPAAFGSGSGGGGGSAGIVASYWVDITLPGNTDAYQTVVDIAPPAGGWLSGHVVEVELTWAQGIWQPILIGLIDSNDDEVQTDALTGGAAGSPFIVVYRGLFVAHNGDGIAWRINHSAQISTTGTTERAASAYPNLDMTAAEDDNLRLAINMRTQDATSIPVYGRVLVTRGANGSLP